MKNGTFSSSQEAVYGSSQLVVFQPLTQQLTDLLLKHKNTSQKPEVLERGVPVCRSCPSHWLTPDGRLLFHWGWPTFSLAFSGENQQLDCPTAKRPIPCQELVSCLSCNHYLLLLDVSVFPSRVPGSEWWSKILVSFPVFLPTPSLSFALTKPNASTWSRCVTYVLLNIWLILCGGQRSVQILEWATLQLKKKKK